MSVYESLSLYDVALRTHDHGNGHDYFTTIIFYLGQPKIIQCEPRFTQFYFSGKFIYCQTTEKHWLENDLVQWTHTVNQTRCTHKNIFYCTHDEQHKQRHISVDLAVTQQQMSWIHLPTLSVGILVLFRLIKLCSTVLLWGTVSRISSLRSQWQLHRRSQAEQCSTK